MVRRNRTDPLLPLPKPTWLVVRNACRQPLEWQEIPPATDLRATLEKSRSERTAAGWVCEDVGRFCSFFFAVRAGVRIQVTVERYDPAGPGAPGHSDGGRG